jgi:hypothetical protein
MSRTNSAKTDSDSVVGALRRVRQAVAILQLRRAEVSQISADTRLSRKVTFRAQQLDKLRLSIHHALCEQAGNSPTPLVLFEVALGMGKGRE